MTDELSRAETVYRQAVAEATPEGAFAVVGEALRAVVREARDHNGCAYAGPGRGDCEHFVGLPGEVREVDHDGPPTEDVYGKPNGWCWFCWQSYRLEHVAREARREALEEFHGPRRRPSPGWLCPACGAGNAPWVAQCPCKRRGEALLNPVRWRG